MFGWSRRRRDKNAAVAAEVYEVFCSGKQPRARVAHRAMPAQNFRDWNRHRHGAEIVLATAGVSPHARPHRPMHLSLSAPGGAVALILCG
jgi:hypothetical protein